MTHSIKVVIPDGSMQEKVSGLFAKAGMPITLRNPRTKEGKVPVDWISQLAFQRPQEIPHYLNAGHFDVAIVGEDWIANHGYTFPVLLKLSIGRGGNRPVRIVLAVPKECGIAGLDDLPRGSSVATEYVELVKKYFADNNRGDLKVIPSYGNTEHKVKFGAAAIVDVTESGESLRENGLTIIVQIMESHTVMVVNQLAYKNPEKRKIIDTFCSLIKGAAQASQYVLMVANVPYDVKAEAAEVLGGLKGPSCSPLISGDSWFALQSVVKKEDETRVIADLLKIGVTDIVVYRDIPLIMN